jgi:hypothetical protein
MNNNYKLSKAIITFLDETDYYITRSETLKREINEHKATVEWLI